MRQDLEDTVENSEEKPKTLCLSLLTWQTLWKDCTLPQNDITNYCYKSDTHFCINQPEGNDDEGSDCSNTPSPHHQDLCPG